MITNVKNTRKPRKADSHYVACENCGMEPVCRPVATGSQQVPLSDSYLHRREPVAAGVSLFRKGEPMSGLFAVSSGAFRLVESLPDGSERVLGFRFPGELLGDEAFHTRCHQTHATAITNSSVCRIQLRELEACSELVPAMQRNIIELLSRQNHYLQQQINVLVSRKNAEQQLVAFLLDLASRQTEISGNRCTFDMVISRDNMASFLGFRRETLSRLFTRLQKKGLVRLQSRQVELCDLATLTELALKAEE